MAGVDTIFRIVGAIMSLFVIGFITAVGYSLIDPISQSVISDSLMTRLGWGNPDGTVITFMGLGLIGLTLTVLIWLKVAPIRNDVRQEQRPPF